MESLLSLRDATLQTARKTYQEVCNSGLGLSKDVFTYSAVSVESSPDTQGAIRFVIAASDDSLSWVECVKRDGRTSITALNRVAKPHQGLTCLKPLSPFFSPTPAAATLMTGGRDGLVKLWSANARSTFMEFNTPNAQPVSAIAHFSSVNQKSLFAAGTELVDKDPPGDVVIYVWAMPDNIDPNMKRRYNTPILSIVDSHTDSITNLVFRASSLASAASTENAPSTASHKVHLVSSSIDGLINIIDPNIRDEDDAVLTVLNNRSAVQHVKPYSGPDFKLLESGQVCAVSQDEKFSVHAVAESTSEEVSSDPEVVDLRKELKCDYAIGLLEQQGGGSVVLAVGAFKEETTSTPHVVLYEFKSPPQPSVKPELEPIVRLQGGHGEELVRDVWFHDDCPFILTCGEDGLVRVWEEAGDAPPSTSGKSKKTPQTKGKRSSTDPRYKPY